MKTIITSNFENSATIQFDVLPNLYVFRVLDLNTFFSVNETAFESPEFTYDQSENIIFLKFSYSSDVSNKTFKLMFTPSVSTDERFWATNSTDWEFQLSSSVNYNSEEEVAMG